MTRQSLFLTVIGLAILGRPGLGWSQCEIGPIAPADGRAEQQFGHSVAIRGRDRADLTLRPAEPGAGVIRLRPT